MHVRAKLRIVYAVDGRRDVMSRGGAYRGAVLRAIEKRCTCERDVSYHGEYGEYEACEYHEALAMKGTGNPSQGTAHRLAVLDRLAAIYKAQDAKVTPIPEIDMSHMRKDELEAIQAAIDWHLQNGAHKPARKNRRAKE